MIEIVYDGMTDEEQKELLQVAKESGQHLLSIFNDLLDFSKMEAGYMKLRETAFDPKEAIKSVLDIMTSVAHKKNIFLLSEVEPELPILYGDSSKLRQILLNLLGNAIKFTSEGGAKVQASVGDSSDGVITVQFAVSDTGIGISPAERKHLFEPFSQVDNSSTRKYGGTGLGLAITKGLVELMGGRIGLSSIKGKGSTFFFSIPFHVADDSAGGGSVPAPAEDTLNFCPILNGDILVAEDNAVLQMLRKRQLENIGFQVDIVSDGKSAVRAAKERSYGVILMDLQLPEMDGYKAAEEIRRLQKTSGIRTPIIAITASMDPGEQTRCTSVGIDELLRKPVSAEQLANALSRWINFPKEAADTKMPTSDMLID
jgi:CheY-like chemotaxis protein